MSQRDGGVIGMSGHKGRANCPRMSEMAAVELAAPAGGSSLPELVRDHLGRQLQSVYASFTTEEQPQRLLDLIAQLDVALATQDTGAASKFRDDLLAALPGLRTFAMSLVANSTRADDLVQETLLKAWASSICAALTAPHNARMLLCREGRVDALELAAEVIAHKLGQ